MAVNIKQFSQPLVYMYGYDQLNRLMNATTYNGWNGVSTFAPSTINDYKETLTYDPNGNILTNIRNGTTSGGNQLTMDNLTYQYPKDVNGNLINNQLRYVYDGVASGNYNNDIDNQTTLSLSQVQAEKSAEVSTDNYQYDAIGNLVKDVQGGISSITWTVYGKIKTITKSDGTVITYTYDATGNRIGKGVTKSGITTTTWYVRDASGSVMAVYTENTGVLKLTEQHLYGSARIGILNKSQDMDAGVSAFNAIFTRGMKNYELTNHLGNVLVTISDKKLPAVVTGGVVTAYSPVVVSANDNYSFGMQMPQRSFSSSAYRYGFNGKEKDNDINSTGADYDYGERIYDPRIQKWFGIDPVVKPWLSPYEFGADNPVNVVDMAGKDEIHFHSYQTIYKGSDGALLSKSNSHIEIVKDNGPDRFFYHSHFTNLVTPTANSSHSMSTTEAVIELHPWDDKSRHNLTNNSNTSVFGDIISNSHWGGDRDYVTLIKYINANPALKSFFDAKANDKKWDWNDADYKKILKDAPKFQTLENIKQNAELAAGVLSIVDGGLGIIGSSPGGETLILPKTMTSELDVYQAAAKNGDLIKISTKGTASKAKSIWEAENGPVPNGYDVDHIIQRQFGGTDDLSNLQLKKTGLNRSEGAKAYQLNKNVQPGTKFTKVQLEK